MKKSIFLFLILIFPSIECFAQFDTRYLIGLDAGTFKNQDGSGYSFEASVYRYTTPVPTQWIYGMCDLTYFGSFEMQNDFSDSDFQLTVRGGAMASLFFATVGLCPSYNFQKNLFTFDYFAGFQGGFRFSQYLGSRFEAFFRAPIALNDKYSFSLKLALVLHEPWQKKLPSFSGK